jgi:hypothetical protein
MTAASLVLDPRNAPAQTAIPTSDQGPAAAAPRGLGVVGAPFPRAWSTPQVLPPLQSTTPAGVFSTGCRFLRRTIADQQAYLAAAVPTAPIRPLAPPVGARFPRWARVAAA